MEYEKKCKQCNRVYYTESRTKSLCPECVSGNQKRRWVWQQEKIKKAKIKPKIKPKSKPTFSITDVCRAQNQYFEEHKVWLSYSETVEMLERGEICVTNTEAEK